MARAAERRLALPGFENRNRQKLLARGISRDRFNADSNCFFGLFAALSCAGYRQQIVQLSGYRRGHCDCRCGVITETVADSQLRQFSRKNSWPEEIMTRGFGLILAIPTISEKSCSGGAYFSSAWLLISAGGGDDHRGAFGYAIICLYQHPVDGEAKSGKTPGICRRCQDNSGAFPLVPRKKLIKNE